MTFLDLKKQKQLQFKWGKDLFWDICSGDASLSSWSSNTTPQIPVWVGNKLNSTNLKPFCRLDSTNMYPFKIQLSIIFLDTRL